jgi:hypothetical protein
MQNTDERRIMVCPLNGGRCYEGRRDDFPTTADKMPLTCRWWVHLYGKDPQSEKIMDQHDCAIAWLPVTTIETSQNVRQTAASVDKTANVLNEVGKQIANVQKALYIEAVKQGQISGGNPSLNPPPEPED